MKRLLPPVEAGPVRLRLLQEVDLPLTLAWRNQPDIRRWFFHSDINSPEQHARWFQQYLERDDDYVFVIEDTQANFQPVGQVALYHIDWQGCQAEFGRLMIGEAGSAGRGLAGWATRGAIDIAFGPFALEQLYLEVFRDNQRAIHIYETVGFVADRPTVTESAPQPAIIRMRLNRSQWERTLQQ